MNAGTATERPAVAVGGGGGGRRWVALAAIVLVAAGVVGAGAAGLVNGSAWPGATILIGAAAGLVPALRASRLSPTQALWCL